MRIKGSMTVFLSMVVMIVLSLFFTMAESVRLQVLSVRTEEISEQAVESLYSMYLDILWEQYHVLGMDLSFGGDAVDVEKAEKKLLHYMQANGTPEPSALAVDYCRVNGIEASVDAYGILTDGGGAPFIEEAVIYEKSHLGGDVISHLTGQNAAFSPGDSGTAKIKTDIDEGSKALEEARNAPEPTKEEKEAWDAERTVYPEKDWTGVGDPMPDAGQSLTESALGLYIPSETPVSGKAVDLSKAVSHRTLVTGTMTSPSIGVTDRLLYEQYLVTELGSYVTKKEGNHPLDYELEYVLCGESSDVENLKGTIHRILAVREAQNLLSLMSDPAKVAEAGSLATALVGVTLNPVLIETIKYGIIASWAYGESLLDVRTLLGGGKVAVLKTPADWTSTLPTLATCFDAHNKARESVSGISYTDYIRIFLTVEAQEKLGLRAMDMVEFTINQHSGYEMIQLDRLLYEGAYTMRYESGPLFFSLVPSGGSFTFTRSRNRGYSYVDGWITVTNTS